MILVSGAQTTLDDLLESIDVSIGENQPVSNWRKRMDTREENWESVRYKLFEEVVMYSTIPADSVSNTVVPVVGTPHFTVGVLPVWE